MFLDKKKFAKIFNMQLAQSNLSQKQFAEKIHATQQSVGMWVKGERDIKHRTLNRICSGLNVNLDVFADAIDYRRPEKKQQETEATFEEKI